MTVQTNLERIRLINRKVMERDHWGLLFEELSFAVYNAVVARGECVVDCGGNTGAHTMALARLVGPSGKVFTFEPVPEMMAAAQQRNVGFQNITWIAKAASEAPGQATFYYYPNENGLSGLQHRPQHTSEHQELSVEVTTMDQEIADPVSLIKLDIEGAEYHALRGARRILTESVPTLVFENGRQPTAQSFGYTADDFFGYFESLGYSLYFISGMPLLRELWEEPMHPWQFIGIHRSCVRTANILATTQAYVTSLIGI